MGLVKLSHQSPLPFDSMVLSMSILPNSKLTWSHTHVFTSLSPPTHQSSLPKKHTTNNFPSLKSPTLVSSQPTKWSNVIHDTVNTWPAVSCTVVMSFQRMSTHLSPTSRPREPSNSSTGVQLVSRSVSTTNHQPSSQVVIWPRSKEPSACCPTLPQLPRPGPDSITNSILCTPRELSFTGMLVKVWKKVNSQKQEKIWPPSKRITKKSALIPSTVKTKAKVKNIKCLQTFENFLSISNFFLCLWRQ